MGIDLQIISMNTEIFERLRANNKHGVGTTAATDATLTFTKLHNFIN